MAVNRIYNNSNGERQEETTFVDIEAWGRQAETISKYVNKGNPLFVEGRLKLDTWENNEGEKRSRMKIVLEVFEFISQRGEGGGFSNGSVPDARPISSAPTQKSEDIEEDVPFEERINSSNLIMATSEVLLIQPVESLGAEGEGHCDTKLPSSQEVCGSGYSANRKQIEVLRAAEREAKNLEDARAQAARSPRRILPLPSRRVSSARCLGR